MTNTSIEAIYDDVARHIKKMGRPECSMLMLYEVHLGKHGLAYKRVGDAAIFSDTDGVFEALLGQCGLWDGIVACYLTPEPHTVRVRLFSDTYVAAGLVVINPFSQHPLKFQKI